MWLKLDLRAESKENCNLCRLCCGVELSNNGEVDLSCDFSKRKEMRQAVRHVREEQGEKRKKEI
jgi:uncharacterized Fe-S radical SAM superfamily protein PflX